MDNLSARSSGNHQTPRGAYRGRLAPSPTGFLHLGHARTFWTAQARARSRHGTLVLRNEDLDRLRCKPEFTAAMFDDLRWFGFDWQEGPDVGGSFGPYSQSGRRSFYLEALRQLRSQGFVYPCTCSRRDVLRALGAPHVGEDEPLYPGTCRPREQVLQRTASETGGQLTVPQHPEHQTPPSATAAVLHEPRPVNWRFRVPDGEVISFLDGGYGRQEFVAGKDFGDFVVWRHDDLPAYQLAVVVDDAAMRITEVVRGEDLLRSTARQLLLYRALGFAPPQFYHCPLVTDGNGRRLAKRDAALSLRALRDRGAKPEDLRRGWE